MHPHGALFFVPLGLKKATVKNGGSNRVLSACWEVVWVSEKFANCREHVFCDIFQLDNFYIDRFIIMFRIICDSDEAEDTSPSDDFE